MVLLDARAFREEDFALSHPGGSLGRRLLVRVSDVMHQGDQLPCVTEQTSIRDALLEITQKGLGMTAIVDADGRLTGIFTDGDLRRALDRQVDLYQGQVLSVMSPQPRTITADRLAAEAVQLMQRYRINGVLVVDADNRPIGALNMHMTCCAGVV